MKTMLAAALIAMAATPLLAADEVDPERRALFVTIIEDLGCKMNGADPPKEFLDAMAKNDFVRSETRAIASELFAEGVAERSGDLLILKTEKSI